MIEPSQWLAIRRWLEKAHPIAAHKPSVQYDESASEIPYVLDQRSATLDARYDQFRHLVARFAATPEALALQRTPAEQTLLLALAAFGPELANNPPTSLLADLGAHVRHYLPTDAHHHCADLAIAYGCGWARRVAHAEDPWEGQWDNAILALQTMVVRSIHRALKDLQEVFEVQGFTFGSKPGRDSISYAGEIVMELTRVIPFSKEELETLLHDMGEAATPSDTGAAWQQTRMFYLKDYASLCGDQGIKPDPHLLAALKEQQINLPKYQPRHRITRWDPHVSRWLRHFVADAVYGHALRRSEQHQASGKLRPRMLQGGAFSSSMLYDILAREQGVVVGTLESRRCPDCGAVYKTDTNKQGGCVTCATPSDRSRIYYFPRKNWIVIPREHGGDYEQVKRWTCKACDNLYPFSATPAELRAERKAWQAHCQNLQRLAILLQDPQACRALLAQAGLHEEAIDVDELERVLQRCREQLARKDQQLQQPPLCPLCHNPPRQRPMSVWVYKPAGQGSEDDLKKFEYHQMDLEHLSPLARLLKALSLPDDSLPSDMGAEEV